MNPAAPSRLSPLAAVRLFWSWWVGELLACLPRRLRLERRRRFDGSVHLGRDLWTFRDRRGLVTSADPRDGTSVAEIIAALKGRRRKAKVLAIVPLSRCFVRRTELPRGSARHAGSILVAELDSVLPFAGGSTHWDWFVHGPGAAPGALGVTQVVLKRRDTEGLIGRLADAGVVLASIAVEDDGAVPPRRLPINLLRHDRADQDGRQASAKARRVLAIAAALACLAIVPTAFRQQSATLAAIDQDLADAREAVAPRTGLSRAPLEAIGAALQARRTIPPADVVLDQLAAALPAGSWLNRLTLDKDVLTIEGRTSSVQGLERALAASALFSAGHNIAPAEAGAEVPFTIRLKLKPAVAAPEA